MHIQNLAFHYNYLEYDKNKLLDVDNTGLFFNWLNTLAVSLITLARQKSTAGLQMCWNIFFVANCNMGIILGSH